MNKFILGLKYLIDMNEEKEAKNFLKLISSGIFDSFLFDEDKRRSFNDGIIYYKYPDGKLCPILSFDCEPYDIDDPWESKAIIRNDGIHFTLFHPAPEELPTEEEKTLPLTVACYLDDVEDGIGKKYGELVKEPCGSKNGKTRVIKFYTDDDEILYAYDSCRVLGLTALCMYCAIQRQGVTMSQKIEKVRKFKKMSSDKPHNDLDLRSRVINLGRHIQYQYEPSDNNVHKEFKRHCESWSVRGHYRIYKSGKISFVKPYIKGPQRNSIMPDTTYKLD